MISACLLSLFPVDLFYLYGRPVFHQFTFFPFVRQHPQIIAQSLHREGSGRTHGSRYGLRCNCLTFANAFGISHLAKLMAILTSFVFTLCAQVVTSLQPDMVGTLDPLEIARHCLAASLISQVDMSKLTTARDTTDVDLNDKLLAMLQRTGLQGYMAFKTILAEYSMPHRYANLLLSMEELELEDVPKVAAACLVNKRSWHGACGKTKFKR